MKKLLCTLFIAILMCGIFLPASAQAAGTEETMSPTYQGVSYGNVTLSGYLSDDRANFNVVGEAYNWSYNTVAPNSTCTIELLEFDGYACIVLDFFTLVDGEYTWHEELAHTQLLADGKLTFGWGTWPYEGEYQQYFASPGHPASFVFGRNSGETPVYGDEYDFTIQPDGTLSVIIMELFNNDGDFLARFYIPCFIEGSATTAATNTPVETPAPAAPTTPANSVTATTTASTVLVNNKSVAFDAYNIGGNNYFKLRDIAKALNGSAKQFEVGWDAATNAITLTSSKAYTEVGGELARGSAGSKQATPTASKIYLNGKEVQLTAYNIGGNNYFKLRDLGQAFDFAVDWDGTKNTITIDTGKGYTPEGSTSTPSTPSPDTSGSSGAQQQTLQVPAEGTDAFGYKYKYVGDQLYIWVDDPDFGAKWYETSVYGTIAGIRFNELWEVEWNSRGLYRFPETASGAVDTSKIIMPDGRTIPYSEFEELKEAFKAEWKANNPDKAQYDKYVGEYKIGSNRFTGKNEVSSTPTGEPMTLAEFKELAVIFGVDASGFKD